MFIAQNFKIFIAKFLTLFYVCPLFSSFVKIFLGRKLSKIFILSMILSNLIDILFMGKSGIFETSFLARKSIYILGYTTLSYNHANHVTI